MSKLVAVVQNSLLTLMAFSLAGCDTMLSKLDQVGRPPELETVQAPMRKVDYQPVTWPEDEPVITQQLANSLWQPGNRTFFKDQRARRVGDILKVIVSIADKAELDNSTEQSRDSQREVGAGALFGLQGLLTGWLPGKADPTNLVTASSNSTSKGDGTIDREEKINTEIAAIVTQILPNGNLIIQGDQEVRVNSELREVTITGIVRPEDISAENSIDSNMVAEARISYGGRGLISDVQQPPVGHQVIDALSPS